MERKQKHTLRKQASGNISTSSQRGNQENQTIRSTSSPEIVMKEVIKIINNAEFLISDVKFFNDIYLSLKINNQEYTYSKTSNYKHSIYYQCVNRKKGHSTHKRCLAKANYNSLEKDISIIDLHNLNCTNTYKEKLAINFDYNSQKEDIIDNFSVNQDLSVFGALLLRDKNVEATPKKKRFPLNYDQVKKILKEYRQEDNLNSNISFSDVTLLRTVDGAIFRRCHNQHNLI